MSRVENIAPDAHLHVVAAGRGVARSVSSTSTRTERVAEVRGEALVQLGGGVWRLMLRSYFMPSSVSSMLVRIS